MKISKKLIAGNWKMNGTEAAAVTLARTIGKKLELMPSLKEKCDFLLCPPSLHIHVVKRQIDHDHAPLHVGGQNCAATDNGAFTGEISASMLKDSGCDYVILGHSERRQNQGESSRLVSEKAQRARAHGLIPVICVGETDAERARGVECAVVGEQLEDSIPAGCSAETLVIAYEPVWAIGTGKTATPGDVGSMHAFIRERLKEKLADSGKVRILYGGSVKPDNAGGLFSIENVDGALIGGASLDAGQFIAIAEAV